MQEPSSRHFSDQIDNQKNFNEYAALAKIQRERDVDIYEAIIIIGNYSLPGEDYFDTCKRLIGGVDAAPPDDETDKSLEEGFNSIDLRALQELVNEIGGSS